MNIKELEESEAMATIMRLRPYGQIKEKLLQFVSEVDEDFNRLHASSYVLQNTNPREHDFQVEALLKTVRRYFRAFEKQGLIEKTGERSYRQLQYYRRAS